jgi:hypothetical protein
MTAIAEAMSERRLLRAIKPVGSWRPPMPKLQRSARAKSSGEHAGRPSEPRRLDGVDMFSSPIDDRLFRPSI